MVTYLKELYVTYRQFPRTIKLFYVSDIFFAFSGSIFGTLFNLHLQQIGYTAYHVGLMQSAAAWIMALLAIPVGLAADRFGRRWFYVAGSLLFGVPYMLLPWVTDWNLLMVIFCMGTLGNTLMFVNEGPLLAGEVTSDRRSSVFSFMMVNFFLWNTLGIKLAGFLAEALPPGVLSQYQWPLVIAGLSGISAGLVRIFLPFRETPVNKRKLNLKPSPAALKIAAINLLSGAFMALAMNFNNVILANRFSFSAATISTVLMIGGIVGWFGSVAVPWTSRKFGDLRAYSLVLGIQGALTLLLGLAGSAALFLPLFWVRSVFGTMQMSLSQAFAMGVTADEERATANSYGTVGRNVGSALAANVYGAALAGGNFLLPFGLAGGLALAAAAVTVALFRRSGTVEMDTSGLQS